MKSLAILVDRPGHIVAPPERDLIRRMSGSRRRESSELSETLVSIRHIVAQALMLAAFTLV